MKYSDLEELGFNRNEAIVFIALLKLGEATAGELIKKTGFHRNIVYDNLEKLADKGLISHIIKSGIRHYMISSSESIKDFIEKEKKKVEKKEKIASKLSKEVAQRIKKSETKPLTQLFQGIYGVKHMMNDTLKEGQDFIVFGSPGESVTLMGETFWRNYELKRIKKKMVVKMIFNGDLRNFGNTILNKYTEIKYLPKKFDGLIETTVYGNKIALTVWTEKPTLTLIEDKHVANEYRKYFDLLWRQAKA